MFDQRKITIDMKSAECVLIPITAKEYHDLSYDSLPIFENYDCYYHLN